MLQRKPTRVVTIGNIKIGGNNKIAIQSMTCTKTKDKQATLNQINALYKAGCDIVRVAVLDTDDAYALKDIVKDSPVPIVADIHFDYRLALIAADANVAKIRINPGNIGSIDRIKKVVEACKTKHIPIRIGVNTGSINKEIEAKYGNSSYALVESAKEHIKILEDLDFHDIVVSIKASSVVKTIEAYTLFSEQYDYPVHLGVTEAGTILSGSIKSSVAIGHLLLNGIGDTIRVSLTDDPINEVFAAKEILASLNLYQKPELVSCPTCGRCQYNMIPIAKEISDFLNTKEGKIKVAVMGCAVNGPGEAKDSDIGIAGGNKCALLFKKGEIIRRIPEINITRDLKSEINIYLDNLSYSFFDELNEDIINLRKEIFVNEQGFINEFDDIEKISNDEITWVEEECTFNLEQRKKYRAVWMLFRDLTRASWKACYRDGVLYMSLPSLNGADIHDASSPEVKKLLRSWMSESRHERLVSYTDFIQRMERKNPSGHEISELIADGEELASRLVKAHSGEIELSEAVSPYLQLVTENERDEFTGIKISEIWRYFRLTWSTPAETTPGRTM